MNTLRRIIKKPKLNPHLPNNFIMSYSFGIVGFGSYACFDIFHNNDILDSYDIAIITSLTKIE